jgi:Tfp pilus assembly protein PilF
MMKNEDGLPWLVKSSGRIMGPYSLEQIEELLKTREIVVLDEVAQPQRRFRYIRDVQAFGRIIDELRREATGDTGEKTFTGSDTSQTASLTEPLSTAVTDELTDEVGFGGEGREEIVYDHIQEEISKPKTSPVMTSRYQMGAMGDRAVHHKAEAASKGLWWATAVVIALVLGFIGYKKMIQTPQRSRLTAQDYVRQGEELVVEGRLPEALQSFKKAHELAPEDKSFLHYLGPLMIQLEGQTVIGRRLLEQALTARPDFKPQIFTSMGIADFKDGNINGAETQFQRAVEQNRDYLPAQVDLGVVALQHKDYAKAKSYFEGVIKKGGVDKVVPLLLAQSMIHLSRSEKKFNYLKEAVKVLTEHKSRNLNYRQEALLMIAYLQSLTNQKVQAEQSVSELLDVDPMATDLHTHNTFILRNPAQWDELLAYCLPLTRALNPTGRVAALTGLCYLKAGKNQEANTEVQTALQRSPRDPLVQAVSAYVLQVIGQEQSGSVSLGKALEFDRGGDYSLPLILQGRLYYLSNDFRSAQEYWKRLLNVNSQSPEAHAGLAWVAFKQGMKEEFRRNIQAAQKESVDYIPVTSLAAQARQKRWEF